MGTGLFPGRDMPYSGRKWGINRDCGMQPSRNPQYTGHGQGTVQPAHPGRHRRHPPGKGRPGTDWEYHCRDKRHGHPAAGIQPLLRRGFLQGHGRGRGTGNSLHGGWGLSLPVGQTAYGPESASRPASAVLSIILPEAYGHSIPQAAGWPSCQPLNSCSAEMPQVVSGRWVSCNTVSCLPAFSSGPLHPPYGPR